MSHPLRPGAYRQSVEVADGVFCIRLSIVNAYLVGEPGAKSGDWVLVDAGLATSAHKIIKAAEELYGEGSRPAAILLTHGHFDHVGALQHLAELWDVPVYAHVLELPYLDGESAYPPPDPTVGGGMAWMSPLYPRGPINLGSRLHKLPSGGDVPHMRDWQWIHTPGHTPGHVSFYRPADATLIAGDAFVTTRQESMLGALLQPEEVNGPPKYFTPDWESAWVSVATLSRIFIEVAATGHGMPMRGMPLRRALEYLADHFDEVAIPDHGRYTDEPAVFGRSGVESVPPPESHRAATVAIGVAVLAGAAALMMFRSRQSRS